MSNQTVFDHPVRARIMDMPYVRYGATLVRLGLPTREFRVISENRAEGEVVVHPEDLSSPSVVPFKLRRDIVEYLPES